VPAVAAGSDAGEMARVGTTIRIVTGALAVSPVESVTCAVKSNDPACVGVPLKTPSALRDSPGGSDPANDQVYGLEPPVAVRVTCGEGRFRVTSGNCTGLIARGGFTRIEN